MYATDFMYDKECLSDYKMMIVNFDKGNGINTVSNGSQISFNMVKPLNQNKWNVYGSEYSEYLTATIQICKKPSKFEPDQMELTAAEISHLSRWLNRKEFCKFKILQDDYIDIYFEGSFNISRIEIAGKTVGLELQFISNRPYGYLETLSYSISTAQSNEQVSLYDQSDEIGFIYPDMTIKCLSDGDLEITNSMEDRSFYLGNVKENELITIHGKEQLIESSLSAHQIYNDFNFQFLRIGNKYVGNTYEENTHEGKKNILTISLPCEMTLSYNPIRKISL